MIKSPVCIWGCIKINNFCSSVIQGSLVSCYICSCCISWIVCGFVADVNSTTSGIAYFDICSVIEMTSSQSWQQSNE